jgi:hypothetical protein
VKSSCDRQPEEALRPRVHLARDTLGGRHEHVGAIERQLEVALVVERHAVDLAERILAVEHPAVGSGEERIGDVADAVGRPGARARRRPGALDPLALQIVGNDAAVEVAGAGIAHSDGRSLDRRVGGQEADPLVLALAASAPCDARLHEHPAPRVEGDERGDRIECGGREHVAIVVEHARTQTQHPDRVH